MLLEIILYVLKIIYYFNINYNYFSNNMALKTKKQKNKKTPYIYI